LSESLNASECEHAEQNQCIPVLETVPVQIRLLSKMQFDFFKLH
jgi:hypothetical protein